MTREESQGPSEQKASIGTSSKALKYSPHKDRLWFSPNDENLSNHGSEAFRRVSLVALVDVLDISILQAQVDT